MNARAPVVPDRHDAQMDPLRRVHAGTLKLILRSTRNAGSHPHIQLFGSEGEAYCGLGIGPLAGGRYLARLRASWTDIRSAGCCRECLKQVELYMRTALAQAKRAAS